MTLSRRIAVTAATLALAVGGATPALATSMKMSHWSTSQCHKYANKYKGAKGTALKAYNNNLKDHACKYRIK